MKGRRIVGLVVAAVFMFALACGGGNGGGGTEDTKATEDSGPAEDSQEPGDDDIVAEDTPAAEDAAPDLPPEIDDKPPIPTDCGEAATLFEACGGDVVGVWSLVSMCLGVDQTFENPMAEMCPESSIESDFNVAATFTFTETTLTTEFQEMEVNVSLTIPETCFEDSPLSCDGLDQEEDLTCGPEGEDCICTTVHSDAADEPEVSDYVVEGNELVVTDSEGDVEHVPYCVSGNLAIVEITELDEEDGTTTTNYMLLEKQ